MAQEDLKKNSDTCKECRFLKINDLVPRSRGFKGRNDLCRNNERRDSEGQPLQAKKQKRPDGKPIIEIVFEMFVQSGPGLRWSLKVTNRKTMWMPLAHRLPLLPFP